MQTTPLPNATLAEFFRFALLLTGDADSAQRIVTETLVEGQNALADLRHDSSRQYWLATNIRRRCLQENAGNMKEVPRLLREESVNGEPTPVLGIEAFILAQRFSTLPEPSRTALALFYIDVFTTEEMAKLLKATVDELAELVSEGRRLLAQSMQVSASA